LSRLKASDLLDAGRGAGAWLPGRTARGSLSGCLSPVVR